MRHVDERKKAQATFQSYVQEQCLVFDSRAFQKVIRDFFGRPWDGIVFQKTAPAFRSPRTPESLPKVKKRHASLPEDLPPNQINKRPKIDLEDDQFVRFNGEGSKTFGQDGKSRTSPGSSIHTTPHGNQENEDSAEAIVAQKAIVAPKAIVASKAIEASKAIVPQKERDTTIVEHSSNLKIDWRKPLARSIRLETEVCMLKSMERSRPSNTGLSCVDQLLSKLPSFRSVSTKLIVKVENENPTTYGILLSISTSQPGRGLFDDHPETVFCEKQRICYGQLTAYTLVKGETLAFLVLAVMESGSMPLLYVVDLTSSEVVIDGEIIGCPSSVTLISSCTGGDETIFNLGFCHLNDEISLGKLLVHGTIYSRTNSLQIPTAVRGCKFELKMRTPCPLRLGLIIKCCPTSFYCALTDEADSSGPINPYWRSIVTADLEVFEELADCQRNFGCSDSSRVGMTVEAMDQLTSELKLESDVRNLPASRCARLAGSADLLAILGCREAYLSIVRAVLLVARDQDALEALYVGTYLEELVRSVLETKGVLTLRRARLPGNSPAKLRRLSGARTITDTRPMWDSDLLQGMGLTLVDMFKLVWQDFVCTKESEAEICTEFIGLLGLLDDEKTLRARLETLAHKVNVTSEDLFSRTVHFFLQVYVRLLTSI